MDLVSLIERLRQLEPNLRPSQLARTALLVLQRAESLGDENLDSRVEDYWRDVTIQMQAATDQHAAVAEELDELASSDPCEFSPNHIWTLIRAIKVQSQIINLYIGQDSPLLNQ